MNSNIKNRHAYMIAIHKNTNQVATLLEMMDCEENDFIIHIDAKSKDIDEERLRASVKYGRIFFSDRVDENGAI